MLLIQSGIRLIAVGTWLGSGLSSPVSRLWILISALNTFLMSKPFPASRSPKLTEYASQDKAAYEAEIATIPLHRWGEENDIAGVAIMLCSAAGAFITGQIIAVDGGTTLVS